MFFAEPVDNEMRIRRVVARVVRLDVGAATNAAGKGDDIAATDGITCSCANAMLQRIAFSFLCGRQHPIGLACTRLACGANAGANIVLTPMEVTQGEEASAFRASLFTRNHAVSFLRVSVPEGEPVRKPNRVRKPDGDASERVSASQALDRGSSLLTYVRHLDDMVVLAPGSAKGRAWADRALERIREEAEAGLGQP